MKSTFPWPRVVVTFGVMAHVVAIATPELFTLYGSDDLNRLSLGVWLIGGLVLRAIDATRAQGGVR